MNRANAFTALQRALQLSRELATAVDAGNLEDAQRLDAERLQLLKSARLALQPLDADVQALVREIAELNDRSIGGLEHRFRAKCRDLDMLAAGRRAVRAYSNTAL